MSFLKAAYMNLNYGIVSVDIAMHNPIRKRPLLLKDFSVFISWATSTVKGPNCQEANLLPECPA